MSMNMKKFIAPTARQALNDIREELGEDAVILSNRKVPQGIEIIAMAGSAVDTLAGSNGIHAIAKPLVQAAPEPAQIKLGTSGEKLMDELRAMQSALKQQLADISSGRASVRESERDTMLRRLLNSGFSVALASMLLDKMPAQQTAGDNWVKQILKRNLRVIEEREEVTEKGGVFALVGPTGVGKTTTTAKLAARAVVRYGADKVALITTDSYRIGAYEQLKIYGKILGVAVHAVKDMDDLKLTLSALRHKKLVLIDTVGMGQRDDRVGDQNAMFDACGVKRLLLLNATASGDTLEEVVRMYHCTNVVGSIITKLDEAVGMAPVLDVAIRHRLPLHFIANGQRVPEDLHQVNVDFLLHRALKPREDDSPFSLQGVDMPAMQMAARRMEASHAF
ncbi:MAG: flagellar biosynthesis protein FlhF [Gallionella sp.]|nr:flagellar biosynthesis protein FlhF [Gallionella sp.]